MTEPRTFTEGPNYADGVEDDKGQKTYFVFDVESVGLHGEGFAVGGGIYTPNGVALPKWEFNFACHPDECLGTSIDRVWIKENVPMLQETHKSPKSMRADFWEIWTRAKASGSLMAADCGWPVEAGFLASCITDDPNRKWEGPYPLHEIATFLTAAGLDSLDKNERLSSELPEHDPLADARQSARMLALALSKIAIETGRLK